MQVSALALWQASLSPQRAAELGADLARLQTERREPRLTDEPSIARLRREYGAQVRAWRAARSVDLNEQR